MLGTEKQKCDGVDKHKSYPDENSHDFNTVSALRATRKSCPTRGHATISLHFLPSRLTRGNSLNASGCLATVQKAPVTKTMSTRAVTSRCTRLKLAWKRGETIVHRRHRVQSVASSTWRQARLHLLHTFSNFEASCSEIFQILKIF